jgi:hypothetical protein
MERFFIIIGRVLWTSVEALFGAAVFWIPDIVVHSVTPRLSPLIGLVVFSWFLPVITLVGLEVLCRHRREGTNRVLTALAMIFGIWVFGPLCTAINLNLSGGSFDLETVAVLTAMFPLSMIDLSTYDGTLFAIFLTTLVLLISAASKRHFPKWYPINKAG